MTQASRWWIRPWVISAVVVVTLVAIVAGLALVLEHAPRVEARVYDTGIVEGNESILELFYVGECGETFQSAKVVFEDSEWIVVEVWLNPRPEGMACPDSPNGGVWFSSITVQLREPVSNRRIRASGVWLASDEDPCWGHMPLTIVTYQFSPSGLTGEVGGSSLESEYESDRPWVTLDIITGKSGVAPYGGPESWLELRRADTCGWEGFLAVIDQDQLGDVRSIPSSFVGMGDFKADQYRESYPPSTWSGVVTAMDNLVALPATSGGLALCYREDLLEGAGLPSTPEEVAMATGDTWQGLIDLGVQYREATGKAFLDDAGGLEVLIAAQADAGGLEAASGAKLTQKANDAGIGAGIGRESDAWDDAVTEDTFAAAPCSMPMLDRIAEASGDEEPGARWAVTGIPGPGGDLDGTYYVIPSEYSAKYAQEEAYNVIEWLIQSEQQIRVAHETGTLPARIDLLTSDEVASWTHPLTGDTPVGAVFAASVLEFSGASHDD